MGTCYICGKQHVDYRRNVEVGQSLHQSVSSKGTIRTSGGSYYGTRTVCAKCALDIDYKRKKSAPNAFSVFGRIILFILILIFCVFFVLEEETKSFILKISTPLLIISIISLVKGIKQSRRIADEWYQKNKDEYIDDIDIAYQEQQKRLEEKHRIEEQKVAEYNSRLQNLNKQLQESSSVFNERLNQEIAVINNKVELANQKFHCVEETEDELKECLKELENLENEMQKSLKSVNKICDDYVKQCKSLVWDKKLLPPITENIEANRAQKINYLNSLISSVKEHENKFLKALIALKQ